MEIQLSLTANGGCLVFVHYLGIFLKEFSTKFCSSKKKYLLLSIERLLYCVHGATYSKKCSEFF